ncbi:MAG: hypothetical protein HY537_09720 [Deltaproteobacteria bacterium]|nr:hypothetical protein [Deltaproteobacteria bacterium]
MLQKMHGRKSVISLLSFTFLCFANYSFGRTPDEAEFRAAESLGEDIARWISKLERPPTSLGIFSVNSNFPLEQDYSRIVERELMKHLVNRGVRNVTGCPECRAAQVNVHDERVIISKGAPDLDTLRMIGKKMPVETFLMVDIYRTKIAVIALASLYQNPSGSILGVERFTAPALSLTDASVQLIFTLGPGKIITGKGSEATGLPYAGNLTLVEELGFGKGGLNLGGVIGNGTTLIYLNPTLLLRGRFGASHLAWSTAFGVGYGFTAEARGLSLRGAFEIYLGSFTIIGLEGMYFLPSDSSVNTLNSYAGFHIGLGLGR